MVTWAYDTTGVRNVRRKVLIKLLTHVYFPVLLCLSVSVKWLAVKTASEMTYTVSGGALNSAQPQPVNTTTETVDTSVPN